MSRGRRIQSLLYLALAGVALVGTQSALIAMLRGDGGAGSALGDLVATPAAVFATVDLLAVALAATVFMVVEGRRLRMPWLWVYVLLVFTVAVSVAFPLFLFARLRHLPQRPEPA